MKAVLVAPASDFLILAALAPAPYVTFKRQNVFKKLLID